MTAARLDRLRAALVERYALEREVGRGGMATVYLARDLKHGRLVAIKVLRPDIAASLGPERFLREIELAARLSHPHILPLHDSGEAAGFLFYVMPYIEGESLRDRLAREGQFPLEDALRITREVASALSYAHTHDVVHRDIKPENILLSGGEAVVADFGIARAITQAAGTKLTETGILVGTPAYMSPEQASGGGPIDGRSDVYSLACVLYEMLTGEQPYTGLNAHVVIAKRVKDPVPSARRLRETIPATVDAAIRKALAKSPADRFRTPAEFARALEGAVTVHPSRVGSYASIVTGLILLAGLAYGVWARRLPRRAPDPRAAHKMLVVLPLENLGAPDDEYFADGLSEAITTRLGSVPTLRVIARQSSIGYKRTTKSPQVIAKELGVDYLLAGTVRWEKSPPAVNRVRVSTALVRASDASQLWAKQYDTVLAGVFGVESNLAAQVAGALNIALADSERQALAVQPTRSLEAHDLYLRGRFFFNKFTEPDLRHSLVLYQAALAKDPHYALPWAGIADTWIWLADAFVAPREAYPKAREAALAALRIDSTLAEGLAALGAVELFYDRDFAAAGRDLDHALVLNPSDRTTYIYGAALRGFLGQFDSSNALFAKAQSLDPLSSGPLLIWGNWLMLSRRHEQAIRVLHEALEIDPHAESVHEQLGYTFFIAGRRREALEEFARAGGTPPDILARLGRAQEAQRRLAELIHERTRRYQDAIGVASGYANLGKRDLAFAWLDTAYHDRSAWLLTLASQPLWDSIRPDPRFQELVNRVAVSAPRVK